MIEIKEECISDLLDVFSHYFSMVAFHQSLSDSKFP